MESATGPLAAASKQSTFGARAANDAYAFRDERALLLALRRGNRHAFTALVDRHQNAIYGYLCARLVGAADAEDLCQEVFLRAYQQRTKFDRATAARPWLIGIARNVLHEHVRRVTRRREVAWTELCLELESLLASTGDQSAEDEDALSLLPGCLDSLGTSAREALDLRYSARLPMSAIGEKLHRSAGAVKLLMYRARQALKHCLTRKLRARDR